MVDLRVDEEVHERQPLPRGDGWEVGDVRVTQRPDGRWSVQHGTTTHIATASGLAMCFGCTLMAVFIVSRWLKPVPGQPKRKAASRRPCWRRA